MDRFAILKPIADAAFDRYKTTPLHTLSEIEQTVILIWSLQGEVGNGGFDQFYFNSSGDYAVETVEVLGRIGASRTATLVAEANCQFPHGSPPPDRTQRISELDRLGDSVSGIWDRLENEFYSDPDGLDELLVAYLVRHGALTINL